MPTPPLTIDIVARDLASAGLRQVSADVTRVGAAAQAAARGGMREAVLEHIRFTSASQRGRQAASAMQEGLRALAVQAVGTTGPVGQVARSLLLFSGGGALVLGAAAAVVTLSAAWRRLTGEIRAAQTAADAFVATQLRAAESGRTVGQQYQAVTRQLDDAIARLQEADRRRVDPRAQLLAPLVAGWREVLGIGESALRVKREEVAVAAALGQHAVRVRDIERERTRAQEAGAAARAREVEQYGRALTASERALLADEQRVAQAERLAALRPSLETAADLRLRVAAPGLAAERRAAGERLAGAGGDVARRDVPLTPALVPTVAPETADAVLEVAAGFQAAADAAAALQTQVTSLPAVAAQFGDAFADAFAAAATGARSLGGALKAAAMGEIRQIAGVKAKYYAAQALAALGEAFVPVFNPSKLVAAAKFTAAATAFAALGGAVTSGGGGGGGGGGRGVGLDQGARAQAEVTTTAPRVVTVVQIVSQDTGQVVRQFAAEQARYRNLGGRVPGVEGGGVSAVRIPGVVVVGG